ncbi:MAG: hypothetical protein IPN42_14365 [Methylococcaceae bacterium]|nr:hypothetical protein [Methylococcaceae bacterium]
MSRKTAIVLLPCLLMLSNCAQLPDDYGLYQEPPSAWTVEQNNNRLTTIESLVLSSKSSAAKQQADLINAAELSYRRRQNSIYSMLKFYSASARPNLPPIN